MFTLDATKTALVVIDLQEGILPLPVVRTPLTMWSAARARQKNAAPAARLLLWCASAGPLISPKR